MFQSDLRSEVILGEFGDHDEFGGAPEKLKRALRRAPASGLVVWNKVMSNSFGPYPCNQIVGSVEIADERPL